MLCTTFTSAREVLASSCRYTTQNQAVGTTKLLHLLISCRHGHLWSLSTTGGKLLSASSLVARFGMAHHNRRGRALHKRQLLCCPSLRPSCYTLIRGSPMVAVSPLGSNYRLSWDCIRLRRTCRGCFLQDYLIYTNPPTPRYKGGLGWCSGYGGPEERWTRSSTTVLRQTCVNIRSRPPKF